MSRLQTNCSFNEPKLIVDKPATLIKPFCPIEKRELCSFELKNLFEPKPVISAPATKERESAKVNNNIYISFITCLIYL